MAHSAKQTLLPTRLDPNFRPAVRPLDATR